MSSIKHTPLILAALCFMLAVAAANPQPGEAQTLEDIVYLKDGVVVRGTITEQVPDEHVLIRTRDGNVFRFEMTRIERIAKETPVSAVQLQPEGWRSPGAALGLSFLLSGAGQFYNGENRKGLLHLGIAVVSAGVTVAGMSSCFDTEYTVWDTWSGQYVTRYYDEDCTMYGIGLVGLLVGKAWSMVDAYGSANRINLARGFSVHLEPGVRLARPLMPAAAAQGASALSDYRLLVNVGTIRF
jgi:hypothetical protein